MTHTFLSSAAICSLLFCIGRSDAMPVPATETNTIKQSIDSIVILKSKRQMKVYHHRQLLKAYHVCLGPEPVGAKHFRNDGKTPEGMYYTSSGIV
jgi:murein L,D-transpeptidase YafK